MLVRNELNAAAVDGPKRFDWWPDWRGQTAAIVASGPSTSQSDAELLRSRVRVLAIKENVNLCPWADAVYGCDFAWWRYRRGLADFGGLKLAWDKKVPSLYPDVKAIQIRERDKNHPRDPKEYVDEILVDEPGIIGGGGNSGFQALNLAVQFGATRIIGLGFDVRGEHWYGRNGWDGANNPDEQNFKRWRAAFDGAAGKLRELGIECVIASPSSTLTAYPKMTVSQTLRAWGL